MMLKIHADGRGTAMWSVAIGGRYLITMMLHESAIRSFDSARGMP
jgi:hypothetical protein